MEFNPGDKVRHQLFGIGKILTISNNTYKIGFETFGVRYIDAHYSGLEKIDNIDNASPTNDSYVYVLTKLLRYLRKNNIKKVGYNELAESVKAKFPVLNKQSVKNFVCEKNSDSIVTANLLDKLLNLDYINNYDFNSEIFASNSKLNETNDLNVVRENKEKDVNNANFNLIKAHESEFQEKYYSIKVFKKMLNKIGVPDGYFKKAVFFLGFISFKNYVIKNTYKNLDDYILQSIGKDDFYYYNNKYDLKEYDNAIENLVSELYLIKEDKGVYSTFNLLKKSGIDGSLILTFQTNVKEYAYHHKFFSFNQLYDALASDKLMLYCSSAEKIAPFIQKIEDIDFFSTVSNDFIYGRVKGNFFQEFFRFIMENRTSMDVYDIISAIKSKFNIEYILDDFERDIKKTNYYYSDILEKVYKNKKIYLEEVYL